MKALGTGFGSVDPYDVEIVRSGGRLRAVLHDAARAHAEASQTSDVHLSISDRQSHVMAFAIATTRGANA